MTVSFDVMCDLVGWEFPGGSFTIEGWENFLMYDLTMGEAPRHGFAHPVYAFHAPLAGMGMTYKEFFDHCHAESDDRIRAGEYDFAYPTPSRENTTYQITGEIESVERKRGGRAGLFDLVTFRLDMTDPDGTLACSARNSWIFLRAESPVPSLQSPIPAERANSTDSTDSRSHHEKAQRETERLETGDRRLETLERPEALEPTTIASVSPEKMKILAAILRDPNVIHIDVELVKARGLGDKRINQGPINLGYVTNMLEANFGPGSIRRLQVRFGSNVFEDDTVTAGGEITARSDGTARCEVWLDRADGTRAVSGSAVVAV